MKLLLDTHTLIWWLDDNPRLSLVAKTAVLDPDNSVYVSIATAWELAIKVGLGKLDDAAELVKNFERALLDEGFSTLPISVASVRLAGAIQAQNRDPFDRLLAAQARDESMTLVSSDIKMSGLGAAILW